MRKILKAAMRIGGKIYTGEHHTDVINKAKADGKDISKVNKERDGLFLLSDGRFIDRKQAQKEFGITHSHQIFKPKGTNTPKKENTPIEQAVIEPIDDKKEVVQAKKRKFIIVTKDFSGFGFGLDERNKDDRIIFATNPDIEKLKEKGELENFNNVGKGMIDRFDLKDVMERRDKFKDWYWIFDNNNSSEENEILRKEGFKVCLGGQRAYELENDRESAIKLAEKYGLPSPEWKSFTSPEEGVKYLEANPDKCYVCKPNGSDSYLTTVPRMTNPQKANERMRVFIKSMGFKDYILQEMKPGIEVNVECFFVNGEPKSASLNLECKRVSSDDTGALCGCAFDVVKDVPIDSKIVKMTIGKMFPYYKENNVTGFGDVNVIIGDTDIWFIEKCERLGYNQHPNYFKNIEKKDALNTLADMCDGVYKPETRRAWGASICIYVDFPHEGIPIDVPEELKDSVYFFDGMKKDNVIVETGATKELAVVCGKGYEIKSAFEDALEKCDKLRDEIINLDFRKDCVRDDFETSPIKRYRSLQEMGII